MNKSILITDSLFIFPEHEQKLKDAGFSIERLDKPEASEEEIIKAIKGKSGYILGGIEKITDKIIDNADELKAIVFTGVVYKDFIPNYEYVIKKGITIANTPNGPTHAVAEWAITMALAMNRNIFDLGRTGEKKFMTSKGLEGGGLSVLLDLVELVLKSQLYSSPLNQPVFHIIVSIVIKILKMKLASNIQNSIRS